MRTFEDLDLAPEVVEALAAEGIESPSSFQDDAIPVVRRGNNLIGRAGPGAGLAVAYGAPLLDRLESGAGSPRGVILVPTRERAIDVARFLARLARFTGHAVSALEGRWALPEEADLLLATPTDLLQAVRESRVKLASLESFVLEGAAQVRELGTFEAVETVAEFIPSESQRVVISLPFPDTLESFVEGHMKRAVHVPPGRASDDDEDDAIPHRGRVRYRIIGGDRSEEALETVSVLLGDGIRHVLVHFHSDDEAADVGDALSLHGYAAGAPGDDSVPIWLGTDAGASRKLLEDLDGAENVATLSYRVPVDPDTLDRRHARGGPAFTLLRGREVPHLAETARVAGYQLEAAPEAPPARVAEDVASFRDRIQRALGHADLTPYFLLLEPLVRREGAARVAAAAAALLREQGEVGAGVPEPGVRRGRDTGTAAAPASSDGAGWVRLFMSLGERDEAGPGDILGAITGETHIDGSRVGRIDIHDTFSLVEVDREVAGDVIEAMNGITVKGRSLRVDFDRPRSGGKEGRRRGSG